MNLRPNRDYEPRTVQKCETGRPHLITDTALLDRGDIIRRLSGESGESLQQVRWAQVKTANELKRSNVSIVNQFFSEAAQRSSRRDESDTATLRTALQRKDLEVEFFRNELQRLRQQVRSDELGMQKLEQFKRREDELLKEKLALQERVGRIEQELEHFQSQLSKSSSSSSEKIGLQKEVATLMKGEIELKNQVDFYKDRAGSLEKQLQSLQQTAANYEAYKSQVVLEINILTNLNQALNKESETLKQTISKLEEEVTQVKAQLNETQLQREKESTNASRQMRSLRQQIEQKTLQITLSQNQLRSYASAKTLAQLERDNVTTRIQEDLRSALATIENLKRQNASIAGGCEALRKQNQNLYIQLKQKAKITESVEVEDWRKSRRQEERLTEMMRELGEVRDKVAEKDSLINSLKRELQQKQQEVRTSSNDFARITSEAELMKARIDLSSLRSEVQHLKRENKILEDTNRDLRMRDSAEANAQNTSMHLLNVKLEDKSRKVSELEALLEAETKQNEHIRNTLRAEQIQSQKLRIWIKDQQQRSNTLQKQGVEATEQMFSLRRQLQNTRLELADIKAGIEATRDEPEKLTRQLERAKMDVDRYKSEGDRYKYELDCSRRQLQQAKDRCREGQQLTQVVNELKRQIQELERSGKSKLTEVQIQFQTQIRQKTNELHNVLSEKAKIQNKLIELEQSLRIKQREIVSASQLRKQHEDTYRLLEQLRREYQILQGQLQQFEQTKKQLELSKQEIKNYSSQKQQFEQIRKRVGVLEEKEKAFSSVEESLCEIAKIVFKKQPQIDRKNLFLKIISTVDNLKKQLLEVQRFNGELSDDFEVIQSQNRTLSLEKNHLISEMESLVNRLKQVQSQHIYLTDVAKSAEGQTQRLKTLNNNLKIRLEKEISEKEWLSNRLRGGIQVIQDNLDRAKFERTQVYTKMKQLMDS